MTITLDPNGYFQSDIDPATCDESGQMIIANWLKASADITANLLAIGVNAADIVTLFADIAALVHDDLGGVTADQHHSEDHAIRHDAGALDELIVEDLGTDEIDTSLVLKPDGVGGLAFGSNTSPVTLLISEPGPAELNTPGFFTKSGFTIAQLNAVLTGSGGQSVTWTLRFATDRTPAAGTEVVTGGTTTTSITAGDTITSFTNAVIPANSWVWIETTAQLGTVGTLAVTVTP